MRCIILYQQYVYSWDGIFIKTDGSDGKWFYIPGGKFYNTTGMITIGDMEYAA
ncbi:MAG: hypothetical protein HUJ76_02170 [Parasporobacterium sp.]|nr:hypothetical protein [Parasporobacterium sp.]